MKQATSIKITNVFKPTNEVANTNYLGIVIAKHLKWKENIVYITNKLKLLIYKFYILRHRFRKLLIMLWGGFYITCLSK